MESISPLDLDAAVELSERVRWPHRPADLHFLLTSGNGRIVRDERSGRALGVGMWIPYGDDVALMGMIIVDPAHQGMGIGRRLVETLMADAGDRTLLLNSTDAGRPLYEKLGFRTLGGVLQRQGTNRARAARDASVRDARRSDKDAIVALDAEAFGAPRAGLIGRLLEDGRAVVSLADGAPSGYAVARPFGLGEVVGPVIASSDEEAIALYKAIAARGFTRVDCPSEATGFSTFLDEAGLRVVDRPIRMVLGEWTEPRQASRVFALAGHALG
ncbi:MAG: GNAT family N-acetyltransferase [Gammaproteobacteria bacterium]|nr:GNAT family N-acetyltransferase [Gammaproteobacteria bacterium]